MKKKIKICSLFSGIGGFETGIFHAFGHENVEVVFASEIDKFASQSYGIIYGEKPHGDITKVNEKEIPDHDLLVGGFPCQAFSVSGKRLGFADTRGTLFFEIARIAKEKKPKILFLENVKGLVNHDKGRTLDVIAKTLGELGYAIDFQIVNSKVHEVPQSRERIFIIGVYNGKQEEWNIDKNDMIGKAKKRLMKEKDVKTFNFNFPEGEIHPRRIKDILEENVDSKYYLHKKYTTKLIQELKEKQKSSRYHEEDLNIHKIYDIPKDILNENETHRRLYSVEGISPTICARSDTPKIVVVGQLDMNAKNQVKNVYDASGLSPTLDTAQGGHRQVKILCEDGEWDVRKLTPLECFRLQDFPDSYYHKLREHGMSDTQLYKMAGNAVTTSVIKNISRNLIPFIN